MIVSETPIDARSPSSGVGQTQIRIKGKNVFVPSAHVDGRTVITSGSWIKIAHIHDEELLEGETVPDPASFTKHLKDTGLKADIFTFAQKLDDASPKHAYHKEWDNIAVIPITTFADWWDKRAESSVRRAVRKAAKAGVVTRVVTFDDAFVEGICKINNETAFRQGRAFWHYQKPFEAVKLENLTYEDRNLFLGAYDDQNELIGYVRMTIVDRVANILQILSMVKHFDKRLTNALIAKAVEVCAEKGFTHLTYCNYVYHDPASSLTEFKRRNGFEMVLLPRYFIPLTAKGKLALSLGFHRRLVERIPTPIVTRLLKIRNDWNARKMKSAEGSD